MVFLSEDMKYIKSYQKLILRSMFPPRYRLIVTQPVISAIGVQHIRVISPCRVLSLWIPTLVISLANAKGALHTCVGCYVSVCIQRPQACAINANVCIYIYGCVYVFGEGFAQRSLPSRDISHIVVVRRIDVVCRIDVVRRVCLDYTVWFTLLRGLDPARGA